MYCHLCENGAIGVCRHCFKFYCPDHGNQFCAQCQQEGWSVSPGTSTGDKTRLQSTSRGNTANVSAPATPRVHTGIVVAPVDDLCDVSKFVRLLPAGGAANVNGVLVIVSGVEIYEAAIKLTASIRFNPDVAETMRPYFPRVQDVVLRNDKGTTYSTIEKSGYVNPEEMRQSWAFTPVPDSSVKTLTFTLERIVLTEERGGRARFDEDAALRGPWTVNMEMLRL